MPNPNWVWLSCQHLFVSVGVKLSKWWTSQTQSLSELTKQRCVMRCNSLTYNVCLNLGCLLRVNLAGVLQVQRWQRGRWGHPVQYEGWWQPFPQATVMALHRSSHSGAWSAEPFGFVSTVQLSDATTPLIAVRDPGEKAQGMARENADVSGVGQVAQDGLHNC